MRASLLSYGRQTLEPEDLAAVEAVLRSDWLTGGPAVRAFETAFAAAIGTPHAVAVSSGTAALHAACVVADLRPGDEVITTPLSFCASANAVVYTGATPVFADVDPQRLTLDPDAVAAKITPRTKAILPVDFAGHPADLEAFRALADRHGLRLIEDAAHALGASLGGRRVGSIADLTTFSFHPVKHIACGEGGMVTCADDESAARLRRFRNHGLTSEATSRRDGAEWAYDMVELGANYRLTDLASALGSSQLRRLDANLARRRTIAEAYQRRLGAESAAAPALTSLPEPEGARSAWHLYPVRFHQGVLGGGRDAWIAALRAEGIGVNVHYQPINSLAFYRARGHAPEDTPIAAAASAELISLPMFHGMSDTDVDDVVRAVHKVTAHYCLTAEGP